MTPLTRRRAIQAGAAWIANPFSAGPASAQAWPAKPIRIVTGFAPGGLIDLLARAYGESLGKATGQSVFVDSKPGAAGAISATEVKRAAPDGYTLLLAINSAITVNRVLFKNLGYDPDRDFTMIAYMPIPSPFAFVRTDLGVNNLRELAEYARKHPIACGTVGPGSLQHMLLVDLNRHFNLKIEPVNYRGEVPLMQALYTGEIPFGFGTWGGSQLPRNAGRVKAIAVSGPKRSSKLADVPTFVEQGTTSDVFKLTSYTCVMGPAGMPDALTQRLSDLFVQSGTSDALQKFMETNAFEEPPRGHAAFREIYEREAPIWVRLAKELNLTPQ
jgi:tripartite-type tricarboxylate transporter receptor subunit TctC